jgi:hypothetical protein
MHFDAMEKQGWPEFIHGRKESLARFDYLMGLAREHEIEIAEWNYETFTRPRGDGGYEALPKRDLTRLFMAQLQLHKPQPFRPRDLKKEETEMLQMAALNFDRLDPKRQQQQLQQYSQRAQEDYRRYLGALHAWANYKAHIVAEQKDFKSTLVEGTKKLLAEGFYRYFAVRDGALYLLTPDIHLAHVNPKAGVELRVNLGVFKVAVYLENYDVMIEPHKGNTAVGNFLHPFVRARDWQGVCWGTATPQYQDFKLKRDIYGVLKTLETVLCTYQEGGNPYASIDAFHKAIEAKRELARQQDAMKKGQAVPIDKEEAAEAQRAREAAQARQKRQLAIAQQAELDRRVNENLPDLAAALHQELRDVFQDAPVLAAALHQELREAGALAVPNVVIEPPVVQRIVAQQLPADPFGGLLEEDDADEDPEEDEYNGN